MNNKTIILIMILAILLCFAILFFFANPFKDKKDEKSTDMSLGVFTYEEVTEFEDTTDEYDPSLEPGSELADNNVYITNYELLYDFLTMEAAGSVSYHAAEFLNMHGYGGYHELTIQRESISKDLTYPRFICSINGTDKYIEVRYRTDSKEFEFSMVDKIY